MNRESSICNHLGAFCLTALARVFEIFTDVVLSHIRSVFGF